MRLARFCPDCEVAWLGNDGSTCWFCSKPGERLAYTNAKTHGAAMLAAIMTWSHASSWSAMLPDDWLNLCEASGESAQA